ncbi:MAG TPA: CBS domain-containing protein [Desulfocapsa sulfexigens]|nr:CBS domain-containing protein [Desulfocapsa sulfexigens]HIQ36912.1 CBS domain-containing protein [Desulfocapsa sulfexigens]
MPTQLSKATHKGLTIHPNRFGVSTICDHMKQKIDCNENTAKEEKIVNNKTSVIRDIIIPLDRYPHLNEKQTLQEAIEACMAFRAGEQGRLRYAGLVVVNDKNQLVGQLSLLDILHGLVPHLMDAAKVRKFEGREMEHPDLTFLYEEQTFAVCKKHHKAPVKPLVKAIDFSLPADTHILKALVMMTHRKDFHVPVTDNGYIIGMLCLKEIFNAMCNTYCTSEIT